MNDTQNEIEKEFAAIEQGYFALLYMARKMRDVSIAIAIIKSGPNGKMDAILGNLLEDDLAAIRHARKGIGHLIEDVGNFMDGTDMNAEMDMRSTEIAYELHQAFPDNLDPKWAPYGAEDQESAIPKGAAPTTAPCLKCKDSAEHLEKCLAAPTTEKGCPGCGKSPCGSHFVSSDDEGEVNHG